MTVYSVHTIAEVRDAVVIQQYDTYTCSVFASCLRFGLFRLTTFSIVAGRWTQQQQQLGQHTLQPPPLDLCCLTEDGVGVTVQQYHSTAFIQIAETFLTNHEPQSGGRTIIGTIGQTLYSEDELAPLAVCPISLVLRVLLLWFVLLLELVYRLLRVDNFLSAPPVFNNSCYYCCISTSLNTIKQQ